MKRILLSLTLITSMSLSSCQKDIEITPNQSNTESAQQAQVDATNGPVRTPLTPRLVKYGSRTLSYDSQGRLAKVVDPYQEKTYEYKSNELTSVVKQDGKVHAEVKYTLNANGRCEKIALHRIIYDGYDGKVLLNETRNYFATYDSKSRLTQIQRENKPNLAAFRYEFVYNQDDDLTQVRFFENNKLSERKLYSYNTPYAGPSLVNKDPFNPSLPQSSSPAPFETYLMDLFVDVFGPFHQHLVRSYKHEVTGTIIADVYYKYNLTDNGYLKSQDMYNGVTNVYISTAAFEYKTPFMVNPNL